MNHPQNHLTARTSRFLDSPVVASFLAVIVAAGLIVSGCQATASNIDEHTTTVVRVAQGDTLWSIADRCSLSDAPTGEIVAFIADVNELSTPDVVPGQRLIVPSRTGDSLIASR